MKHLRFPRATRGEGRFIKQGGPPGRFAHVVLVVESTEGSTLEIVWEATESCIPKEFRSSIVQGIHALFGPEAPCASFEAGGLLVRIVGGTSHPTDSNETSFKIAAAKAFMAAVESRHPAVD